MMTPAFALPQRSGQQCGNRDTDMRKIILALAIVCASVIANAGQVTWSMQAVTASPETSIAKGSMIAYFMDGATYDSFVALEDGWGAYAVENALSSATSVVGRNGAGFTTSFGDYSGGDEVSGYIVIFDNADATAANYYAYTAASAYLIPSAGNLPWSMTFSQTSGWVQTPEPTSGLLAILGFAGLALRRRRA